MAGERASPSLFDFSTVAGQYDAFYDSRLGQEIDVVEKRMVDAHLAELERGALLEIGCGTGHWTRFFANRGFRVTGMEVSAEMLAQGRPNPNARSMLLAGDARELPFTSAAFSRIAAITALEFVTDEGLVLSEVDRVLAPGGWLLVGCLNLDSALGRSKADDDIYRDARFYTPHGLRAVLSRFGNPRIDGCAVLDGDQVLDLRPGFDPVRACREGAFLVGSVRRGPLR